MKNTISKFTLVLLLLSGFVWLVSRSEAYPPLLRQATKLGAKDCTYCHKDAQIGGDLNARGKWLKAERDKRNAERIDVEWLADYKEKGGKEATPKAENKGDKWAEQESFHEVMSETFHAAEEGKLEPIRAKAGELAEKAKAWAVSKAPKALAKKDTKELLGKLSTEAKALADSIAGGADDEKVKKDLTALHDRYHSIIGEKHEEKKK